jgi:RNA polymerase sigma-70 factor (ECF subfamily)
VDALRLKAYLGAVARNKAKNKLRSHRDSLPLEDDWITVSAETPEQSLTDREERALVRRAVLEMEESERTVFLLHYYDCRTVSEISQETGMTVDMIKKRLSKGRAKLKMALDVSKTNQNEGDNSNGRKENIRAAVSHADSR